MKRFTYLIIFLTSVTWMLEAQTTSPVSSERVFLHFTGSLGKNTPVDVTIDSANPPTPPAPIRPLPNAPYDPTPGPVQITIISVTRSGSGFVVYLNAHCSITTTITNFAGTTRSAGNQAVGVNSQVFLKPGVPLTIAQGHDVSLTLTLTE